MGAMIDVEAGVSAGVLVVPVTAVRGTVATGNVWVLDVGAEGTQILEYAVPEQRPAPS